MQKKRRWLTVGVCLLTSALAGCTAHHRAVTSAANPAKPPRLTVQTPIDRVAADENGRAVLERDVPGVMHNSHYALFSCMSLAQVASLSGGRLTQAKLDEVNKDLAAIPPCPD